MLLTWHSRRSSGYSGTSAGRRKQRDRRTLDSLDEVAEIEERNERDDPQICGDRGSARKPRALKCPLNSTECPGKVFSRLPSRQTRALSSSSVHLTSRLVNALTSSCESTAFGRSTSDDFSLVTLPSLASVGTSAVGPASAVGDFSSLCDISPADEYFLLQKRSKRNWKGRKKIDPEGVDRGWGERQRTMGLGTLGFF